MSDRSIANVHSRCFGDKGDVEDITEGKISPCLTNTLAKGPSTSPGAKRVCWIVY